MDYSNRGKAISFSLCFVVVCVMQVLVLSAGHELYFGPADKADSWFSEVLGYERPHDASASDYLLDVINIDYQGEEARQSLAFKGMEGEAGLKDAAARFRASQLYHTYIG